MHPKISVLMPVYNVEKYLPQCLQSLQNQTFQDFEIVAINDGSTDSSLSLLESYAAQDKRMRIISQKNMGLACTRNNLLDQAQGKYFVFVDSDDWIREDCLQLLYDRAEQTNADVVQGWYQEYNENTNVYQNCDDLYHQYHGPKPPQTSKDRFKAARSYLQVWGRLVRLSLVQHHQLRCLPYKLAEDTSFSILLYQYAHKIEFLEEYIAFYRRSNATSLSTKARKMAFDLFAQWCYVTKQCHQRHFKDSALYSCLLHLIVRHCMTNYYPWNEEEEKQIQEALKTIHKYSPLCSCPSRWRYKLFGYIAHHTRPKKLSFWARLLR